MEQPTSRAKRADGIRTAAAWALGRLIGGGARLLTGLRPLWSGTHPSAEPTVYVANHTSHGDFVLLWASLPPDLRSRTRPVAARDYWQASALRRFVGADIFKSLMIARDGSRHGADPVRQMAEALEAGDSLILFPEGTRNTGDSALLPLRSGLFHLAKARPDVRLVPVWIENLKRVLPKGMWVPVPLACSVRFGMPLALQPDEGKADFLARASAAMLDLRPDYDRLQQDLSPAAPPPGAAPGQQPLPTTAPPDHDARSI